MRALARGLHMAGSFGLFGTVTLAAALLPKLDWIWCRRVVWLSFGLAGVMGVIWFVAETSDMAGSTAANDIWAALPIVAGNTRFGALLIERCVAMAMAAVAFQFGFARSAALLAGLALAAEAWLGHGGAMTGPVGNVLLVSSVIHLVSGGAWLGSLPALWLMMWRLPLPQAAQLAQRFSPMGMFCVAGLLSSAAVQYWCLVGGLSALVNSEYGLVALLKILVLAALIALACLNRWRLTPNMQIDEEARRLLLRSVGLEVALGFLALLAAGFLLQMTPPTMAAMLGPQG